MGEFDLIQQFFTHAAHTAATRDDVVVGIGDDGAITTTEPNHQLVSVVDTLVSGRHFHANCPADAVGHKSLAVNLSDIAAMGAKPCWATIALTLPESNPDWLQSFANGFFALAHQHNISLIGGDTTQGPLSITVQLNGQLPNGTGLLRSTAQPGDALFVTGTIGLGAIGLQDYPAVTAASQHLLKPTPHVEFGHGLNQLASSCIDVSDGLLADLQHICQASKTGAALDIAKIPLARAAKSCSPEAIVQQLCGGDDYELCFSINDHHDNMHQLHQLAKTTRTPITRIGYVTDSCALTTMDNQLLNEILPLPDDQTTYGYKHF